MTIQGSISLQSVQADITQITAKSERQALAYRSGSKSPSPSLLNTQENQIVDDVNISDAAVKQLQDARALNNQLQRYLDYLKNDSEEEGRVRLIPAQDKNHQEEIAARATSFEASITAGTIIEETLDIDFTLDDEGKLTELTISASKTTTEFVRAEYTLSDTQFYAARD